MKRAFTYALLFGVLATLLASVAFVAADSNSIDFESYSTGSIQGQDGWTGSSMAINTSIDQAVVTNGGGVPASFGTQSWRFSNAYANGSFADWPFSPSLTNEAGETSAVNDGLSGGTRQTYFETQWDFTSADPSGEQAGLQVSTAADRGDGARMSYVRMEDQSGGLAVIFRDYQDLAPFGASLGDPNGCSGSDNFFDTTVASGLARGTAHTVKLAINFVNGPRNDVVRVWVDGLLVHTGTSWEDYFRYCEGNDTRTVNSQIFQARNVDAPLLAGKGFLFDNLSYSSSSPTCTTVCYVDAVGGNDVFSGASAADAKKTIQAAIDTVSPGGEVRVLPGTYPESPDINKPLTLNSTAGRDSTFINLQTGPTYLGALFIEGADVTVDGFTIVGRDGTDSLIGASNILVKNGLDNVVVKNNRLRIGLLDGDCACSTGDEGFGINTYYNTTPAQFTDTLTVTDNIFVPLNSSATRAYYINPGVTTFTFKNNSITGNFESSAVTGAAHGTVQDNTLTGNGSSAGFSTSGYPDPDSYGQTTFTGNHISAVTNGILVNETKDVSIHHNVISSSSKAVNVIDSGDFSGSLDPTSVHVNRNSLAVGASNTGVAAAASFSSSVDGTCNWWGNFSGPGAIASGTGSKVTTNVEYASWLQSSNLDSDCSPNGNLTINLDTHPNSSQLFHFTGTNGIAPFTLKDDGTLGANTKTWNKPAGLYVFQVGALPRWALIKLSCNLHETILKSHRLVQIQLHSDENVVCTFTESYRIPDASIALTSGGPYSGDNIYSGAVQASQTLSQSFAPGETKSFFAKFQNDGLDTDTFRVPSLLKGSLKFHIVFMSGTVEITGKVNAGTYKFTLAPGATRMIEIRVTADASIGASNSRSIILTQQSKTAPGARDTVKAFVNAAP